MGTDNVDPGGGGGGGVSVSTGDRCDAGGNSAHGQHGIRARRVRGLQCVERCVGDNGSTYAQAAVAAAPTCQLTCCYYVVILSAVRRQGARAVALLRAAGLRAPAAPAAGHPRAAVPQPAGGGAGPGGGGAGACGVHMHVHVASSQNPPSTPAPTTVLPPPGMCPRALLQSLHWRLCMRDGVSTWLHNCALADHQDGVSHGACRVLKGIAPKTPPRTRPPGRRVAG